MLTTVILEGPMGKLFGRKWELAVSSPAEALRMIDANRPGLLGWIKMNLAKYSRYRVIIDKEERDSDNFGMTCRAKRIRFVPVVEGASAGVRFVVGAVVFAVSAYFNFTPGMAFGASLMIGAAVEMLMPTPKKDDTTRADNTSHYFDGPANTDKQGVPVPLIYGRVLTGSHAISAALTVDQVAV